MVVLVVCGFWWEVTPVSHAHHMTLYNRSKMAGAIEINHDKMAQAILLYVM